MRTAGVIYGSKVLGRDVKNLEGQDIGKLEDIVFDAQLGRVGYGVIKSSGKFLKSDKLFAIPWDAFEVSKDESGLVLDADKSRLANVPAFDKDSWPDMSDRRWGGSVHTFFETHPYWEDAGQADRPTAYRENAGQRFAEQREPQGERFAEQREPQGERFAEQGEPRDERYSTEGRDRDERYGTEGRDRDEGYAAEGRDRDERTEAESDREREEARPVH